MNKPIPVGVLIKIPKASIPARGFGLNKLGAAGVKFELEPLFDTAATAGERSVFGAVAGEGWRWHLAHPSTSMGEVNPWNFAHEMVSKGMGLAGDAPVFVEPDFLQDWIYENPVDRATFGFDAADKCVFNDQRSKLPGVPRVFAWHLGDGFSQLGRAREEAAKGNGEVIRIAHLDTGYSAGHDVLPANFLTALQRNFADGNLNDASDPGTRGPMKNPGHGTGTLSILAGNKFEFKGNGYAEFNDFVGGAPKCGIVPVRVGTSVVQISTSSVAKGINYVAGLCAKDDTRVHVISMSMGGVASQAWADAVNLAYEAGIVYVAAAGNNYSNLPTRFIVYPARFRRVIAACGVMADGTPYYGLPLGTMQGNWGPESKMATALAAFTPNIPWAELGCEKIVDMDGQGTSSATPQIAAAAALYQQKHAGALFNRAKYPEPWMRVEAVRRALFSAARPSDPDNMEKFGNGILQAFEALKRAPAPKETLTQTSRDRATFAFLRAVTGLGISRGDPRTEMLALEATQLAQRWNRPDVQNPLESALMDPDLPEEAVSPNQKRNYLEAILDHPDASAPLREHARGLLGKTSKSAAKAAGPGETPVPADQAAALPRAQFVPPEPAFRRLRGFAIDPSLSTALETEPISEITFPVPWEKVGPGPTGEYIEVIDIDPGSGCYYEPIDLENPILLAQDGLPPSEGTPQFHQQMVYAVASMTIENFEHALGRRTLWRPKMDPKRPKDDSVFVQRLRIHPHALRERNAFYTPQKVALLFGYFRATTEAPGEHLPGGMVFTCLSHDIIAHETTHALLDGMHRSLLQPTNPDVHAFHEAFSDLVALFQHFTFPEILRHQIAATRGQIRSQENLLGELAGQFGRGMGLRGALRSAIGRIKNGKWKPHKPDPQEYETMTEPHYRGAILVAAVFDAFLSIYERRTSDLLRLATEGTGVLRPGAIHPDLVARLANEAAKSAQHVLTMCIRALDYCPPTDITFGEYLRALITADVDFVTDDDLNYRVAFVEAFRKRGLYPRDVRNLSVQSLIWRGPANDERRPSLHLQRGLLQLRSYADNNLYAECRKEAFELERKLRKDIHDWLELHFESSPEGKADARYLGLDPDAKKSFEVRSARFAYRTCPDGGMIPQLILVLLQEIQVPVNPDDPGGETMAFEGGSTLIANLREGGIRYCVRKSLNSTERRERQQRVAAAASDSTQAIYFGSAIENKEPFAALHRGL